MFFAQRYVPDEISSDTSELHKQTNLVVIDWNRIVNIVANRLDLQISLPLFFNREFVYALDLFLQFCFSCQLLHSVLFGLFSMSNFECHRI